MVHKTTVRSKKGAFGHYQHIRDSLATVRPTKDRTRQQRLALYEDRASRRLPLFGG